MKAVMVMFDSLNRRFLPPYGCGWVKAPNFERLMSHSVCFDNAYAGSLPCMPARRELHSGRYNFMHRGWGPLEPFDDSMPELLYRNGVLSHPALLGRWGCHLPHQVFILGMRERAGRRSLEGQPCQ